MKKSLIIGKYTFIENLSNKIFSGVFIFGFIMIASTYLLSDLSLYEGEEVVKNSSLFLLEFFIALIVTYVSATHIIKSQKEKSIYLILTKPVEKVDYIIGVLIGILYIIFFNVVIMGVVIYGMFLIKNWNLDIHFLKSLVFIIMKLSIVASLGLLFSVISDSFITAILFTFSTYIMGHSVLEFKEIAETMSGTLAEKILKVFYYILPRFNILNYRDYLKGMDISIGISSLYTLTYIVCIVGIASFIFSRKKL